MLIAPAVTPLGHTKYREARTAFGGNLNVSLTLLPELIVEADGVTDVPVCVTGGIEVEIGLTETCDETLTA